MRKKPLLTMLSTAVLSAAAALWVPTTSVIAAPTKSAESSKRTNDIYIVELAELPVAAYTGSIKGYQATKPRAGQKIDPNSPQVVNYKSYLESRHDAVLSQVGGARKAYSYGYVFNGFAASLTADQAARLAATPGVKKVTKDSLMQVDTSSTPAFIGVSASGGLWDQLGGVGSACVYIIPSCGQPS
jgi:hypothetical protein